VNIVLQDIKSLQLNQSRKQKYFNSIFSAEQIKKVEDMKANCDAQAAKVKN
jgi:hypothetical protein